MTRAAGLLIQELDPRLTLANGRLCRPQPNFRAQKYAPAPVVAAPRGLPGRQRFGYLPQSIDWRSYPIDLAGHWARLPRADVPLFPFVLHSQRLAVRHQATPYHRPNRMVSALSQGFGAVWQRELPSLVGSVLSPAVLQYRVGPPRTIALAHSAIPSPPSWAKGRRQGSK